MSAPIHYIDHISAAILETADNFSPNLPGEGPYRYGAARGRVRGADARGDGSGRAAQQAHSDLASLKSDRSFREAYLRAGRHEMSPEETEQWESKIARARRERDSHAESSAADAKERAGARNMGNRVALYVVQVATSGAVLKPKKTKPIRGIPADLLAEVRRLYVETAKEAERVRNAAPPISVYEQQALEQLDQIEARDWIGAQYSDGGISLTGAVTAVDAEPLLPGRVVTVPDAGPMMMALFGKEIRQRVLARIREDHRGDTRFRLPADEKKRRLSALRKELLELQYEEAALLVAIAGPNALEIPFPAHMDPRAALGIEGPEPIRQLY